MKAELTELVFILDRSGSMSGLEDETIRGFNKMIQEQKDLSGKKKERNVNVTTILFDDQVDIIHDRFPLEIIKPLTKEEYFVQGCTALLDAIGTAVQKTDNVQQHLPEEHKAGKVIFVITTDGLENSSEHYNRSQIREMIEAKKRHGWEFLFLGANIDAVSEGVKLGISRNRSVTYENDAKGVELNFQTVGRVLSKAVESQSASELFEDDWAEEIRSYKERKKA